MKGRTFSQRPARLGCLFCHRCPSGFYSPPRCNLEDRREGRVSVSSTDTRCRRELPQFTLAVDSLPPSVEDPGWNPVPATANHGLGFRTLGLTTGGNLRPTPHCETLKPLLEYKSSHSSRQIPPGSDHTTASDRSPVAAGHKHRSTGLPFLVDFETILGHSQERRNRVDCGIPAHELHKLTKYNEGRWDFTLVFRSSLWSGDQGCN